MNDSDNIKSVKSIDFSKGLSEWSIDTTRMVIDWLGRTNELKAPVPIELIGLIAKYKETGFDSTILNDIDTIDNALIGWVFDNIYKKIPSITGVKILYRGTRDGFKDQKGPTLTLVRTEYGHICGGFARSSWHSKKKFIYDRHAFIFLLKGNENILNKYNVKTPLYIPVNKKEVRFALHGDERRIINFGGGDLRCESDCNRLARSWSSHPCSFSMDGLNNFGRSNPRHDLLTGFSGGSKVNEIEIYSIKYISQIDKLFANDQSCKPTKYTMGFSKGHRFMKARGGFSSLTTDNLQIGSIFKLVKYEWIEARLSTNIYTRWICVAGLYGDPSYINGSSLEYKDPSGIWIQNRDKLNLSINEIVKISINKSINAIRFSKPQSKDELGLGHLSIYI